MADQSSTLLLGAAWRFHDTPESVWRFREQALASGGVPDIVGFNNDTRTGLSLPSRHGVAIDPSCVRPSGPLAPC